MTSRGLFDGPARRLVSVGVSDDGGDVALTGVISLDDGGGAVACRLRPEQALRLGLDLLAACLRRWPR